MKWCCNIKKKHLFYTYLLKKKTFWLATTLYATMFHFFTNLCNNDLLFYQSMQTMFRLFTNLCNNVSLFTNLFNNVSFFNLSMQQWFIFFCQSIQQWFAFFTNLCNNGSLFFYQSMHQCFTFLPIYMQQTMFKFSTNLCYNVWKLCSFIDLPNLSSAIYSAELCSRLRSFLVACPPTGPSRPVTDLVIATADFQKDLASWNIK